MPFADLRSAILEPDLCGGCGGCAAVCPHDLLRLDQDGRPFLADAARGEAPCGSCRLCLDVCPGRDTDVARSERRLFGRSRTVAERWTGVMRGIYTVACRDSAIAARAAAGGAGTALLIAGLRAGLAQAVVVIGRDPERPWVPRALVTADEDEIVACSQSTYCIAPTLQLLRGPGYDRLGMVGLPCEMQSLNRMRNLADPPPAAGRVTFTLEIACSSSTRLAGTEHLLTRLLHVDLDEVEDVRYREGEYPGEFVARTRDGRRRSLPFHQLVNEFRAFKTHRCLSCPDWWSGLADVSICDSDPNVFATSLAGSGSARGSTVVVRTEMGERLLALAGDRGLLRVAPATFDPDVNLGLQRKRHRYRDMRDRHPGRVPAPPVPGADDSPYLSDDEVLRRLSTPNARLEDAAPHGAGRDG
jgi:coenzyme F420 hydrogenase subunit beta